MKHTGFGSLLFRAKSAYNHNAEVKVKRLIVLVINNGTVEGLRHETCLYPPSSTTAKPSPGPQENLCLFDRFLETVRDQYNVEESRYLWNC